MLNNFAKMSKGPALYERSAMKYDEDRLRPTIPLDPRAMLHSRDIQSFPEADCSPESVKQEKDEVPLELPVNTVIVKNQFDLAKFSPLKAERAQVTSEEDEDSDGESEGEESGGTEASCSVDSKAGSKGHGLGLFDTEDADDCEPPAKRTRQEEEEEPALTDTQPHELNRDIYQFVFHNGVTKNHGLVHQKDQEKPKPGVSSPDGNSLKPTDNNVSIIKTIPPKNELLLNTVPKERKRAPATFNGTVDKTKHQCSECHKYFQCEAHLQRHMLIHYGLKPFECPVCDKAFRYKSSYKAHLNMHTEEKPLTCSLCDKGFTQSRDLKRHMLSHTDEKNFDCPECGGKFKHKHNLIRHISVIHKEEKPYPCPMCDKAFAQKHDFMTHMRTHSGEKPFSCHVCSRSFGAKGTLRTHMKVHRKRISKELQGVTAFDHFVSEEKEVCD